MKLFDRQILLEMILTELRREGETITPERRAALQALLARHSIHVFYVFTRVPVALRRFIDEQENARQAKAKLRSCR